MQLMRFRIQMYKCVLDSGWVTTTPLTVLVGKNEAGKTSLLTALHKLNPFTPDPYNISREWPRGRRDERNDRQVVCTAEFLLDQDELSELQALTNETLTATSLMVTRDYGNRLEVLFPPEVFPTMLHPTDIDAALAAFPATPSPVGDPFREAAESVKEEATRLASEGRFSELDGLFEAHEQRLRSLVSQAAPQSQNENSHIAAIKEKLGAVAAALRNAPSIQAKAHEYVVRRLPTFVYMDEYRAFKGSEFLDQVRQRQQRQALTDEDETLLTILSLSGLSLDDQVKRANEQNREERQYDLSDASATLTRKISDHWGQLRYEVQFGADGQQFFTWVRDHKDRSLIRLEERSRGFQWFFSFDLLLMHETAGNMKGCVILLDEPGLHLHPEGQKDLLRRLEDYAKGNILVYTSHLPFMIDLQEPDRIRVLSETEQGTVVTDELSSTQPEGRLTLQAALGISGRTSYLVAEQNLVVEGVDDYWYLTALSSLLSHCGEPGLPNGLFITTAGGASEVTYIATLMIGQELDVVALYDTDPAGDAAKERLVNKWLTRYKNGRAVALSLGPSCGADAREFSIEDLFSETFYLKYVNGLYARKLAAVGHSEITLGPGPQLVKRVVSFFEAAQVPFNKGSVAKLICADIRKMSAVNELPPETLARAMALMRSIAAAVEKVGPTSRTR